jgi:hypothetical protein
MEFTVNFRATKVVATRDMRAEQEYDIRETSEIAPYQKVGTDLLIRFSLKPEDIDCNVIQPMHNNIAVGIPHEIAIRSGQFETKPDTYVYVSADILRSFIDIAVGTVKGVCQNGFYYFADETKLREFWEENGFAAIILSADDKKALADRQVRRDEIAAEKEEEKASKERYESEKREWILACGSQYLKDCLEMGVKANLEYVAERATLEFPGFTVDYADAAEWGERVSPTGESLQTLKKLRMATPESEIVWLTCPAMERNESTEGFEPCEAIIIRKYLGKYDLVMIV